MNAGAYGAEMKHITRQARALDARGGLQRVTAADFGFSYRHSAVPADWIFIDAILDGAVGSRAEIAAQMAVLKAAREDSQPLQSRTGGSTFANPQDHQAWRLIDQAGCRGLRLGGAQMSEKHCNFMINTGTASAADLEDLGEEVRRRVRDVSGIELQWEIRRIGVRERAGP
jgi:UDP-N-acetylmuramate dehydrogenase